MSLKINAILNHERRRYDAFERLPISAVYEYRNQSIHKQDRVCLSARARNLDSVINEAATIMNCARSNKDNQQDGKGRNSRIRRVRSTATNNEKTPTVLPTKDVHRYSSIIITTPTPLLTFVIIVSCQVL
jgi:hypothetical protein